MWWSSMCHISLYYRFLLWQLPISCSSCYTFQSLSPWCDDTTYVSMAYPALGVIYCLAWFPLPACVHHNFCSIICTVYLHHYLSDHCDIVFLWDRSQRQLKLASIAVEVDVVETSLYTKPFSHVPVDLPLQCFCFCHSAIVHKKGHSNFVNTPCRFIQVLYQVFNKYYLFAISKTIHEYVKTENTQKMALF